ncbi:hypothetical protein BFJ69_g10454 [Fusarium oxysporum]|uniref:2EXR domain-containing protein n=1 Tax=Fusarium oxysporum TaxID=5507 RepID=A0A420MVK9_FUSOX|nr:hypothetical protein BFJ69_g10454 [Fusarium oxysporum]
MASSVFHKFPQLPPEIQLKIWEASIRPPQAIPGGLHYIALDHMGNTVPLRNTWMDEPERRKSAYQLEEGLLTACRDSRTVILKHRLEQDHFLRQQELRTPSRDLFCIVLNRSAPSVARGKCYPLIACERLAFEYTTSWNNELSNHEGYFPIEEFTASLAFLMRLVIQVASTDYFCTPIIRLIDRNARWINDGSTQGTIETFYDYDNEYIEISLKTGSSSTRIIQHSPVLKFLDHMDRLLKAKFKIFQHMGPGGLLAGWQFIIRDFFSIFVLRRNQAGIESSGTSGELQFGERL